MDLIANEEINRLKIVIGKRINKPYTCKDNYELTFSSNSHNNVFLLPIYFNK